MIKAADVAPHSVLSEEERVEYTKIEEATDEELRKTGTSIFHGMAGNKIAQRGLRVLLILASEYEAAGWHVLWRRRMSELDDLTISHPSLVPRETR